MTRFIVTIDPNHKYEIIPYVVLLVIFHFLNRFLVSILALLYIAASPGATMHLHYCMGRLIEWKFSTNKDEKCSNCGMNKMTNKGCCKDLQKQLKIDDQKLVEANLSLVHLTSVAVIPVFSELASVCIPSKTEEHPLANPPPREQGIPLFIRNCVFRI